MNKSRHKRNKMGCVPGDISKFRKIEMLEKGNSECAKSYRKDFQKKANRKFRHNKEIEES